MNKSEFLSGLEDRLRGFPQEEIKKTTDYYSEMIDDAVENGESEQDVTARLGSMDNIAEKIINELPLSKIVKADVKERKISAAVNGGFTTESAQMQSQTVTEDISKINVSASRDDIRVVSADTDNIKVRYSTSKTRQYNITADNDILSVKYVPVDSLDIKCYDYIQINNRDDDGIVIEIPKNRQYDISLNTASGDIEVYDANGTVYARTANGDIEIANGEFTAVKCSNEYGDIELSSVTADSIKLEVNKGDIDIEDTDGNITAYCNYGDINIENITGDNIELSSDFGDIEGTIRGSATDYSIMSQTRAGSSNLSDSSGGSKTLKVETDRGDVEIDFLS